VNRAAKGKHFGCVTFYLRFCMSSVRIREFNLTSSFVYLFVCEWDRQTDCLAYFTSSTKFDVCYGLVAVSKIRNPCLHTNCLLCFCRRSAEIIFTSIVLYSYVIEVRPNDEYFSQRPFPFICILVNRFPTIYGDHSPA
jgi:hypothetical protein